MGWSVVCLLHLLKPYNASLESKFLLEQVHPLSYLGPYQGLSRPTKVANCFLNRSIKEGAWVLISFFVCQWTQEEETRIINIHLGSSEASYR